MDNKSSQQENAHSGLMKHFTAEAFQEAKANFLKRYRLWHGVLISNDEQSIITPDDVSMLRKQVESIGTKDDYNPDELEQVKILTIMIHLLLSKHPEAYNNDKEQPFIVREILGSSNKLNIADIKQLLVYQNDLLPSHIKPLTSPTMTSADGVNFQLEATEGHIELKETDANANDGATTSATSDTNTIFIKDESSEFLHEGFQSITLDCGVTVGAASFIGKEREQNEDGIMLMPPHNQFAVIDAMGGYGNGVKARDIFMDMIAASPNDIAKAVKDTQLKYDLSGLTKGGVCVMHAAITKNADDYTILLSQAGDVHAFMFDQDGRIQFESEDESIGHQVINAIVSNSTTLKQRISGCEQFGTLTATQIEAKPGWRLAIYSDGIANNIDALNLAALIGDKDQQKAIAAISQHLEKKLAEPEPYNDNTTITIVDF